jgi:hypothetical protein
MENQKKYYCDFCKYTTDFPSDWIKHCDTIKHQRLGKKISHKCQNCDYETKSKWNLKLHIMATHTTQEEKEKLKFYCKVCDQVFFCKLYSDKHNTGKKHSNKIKANELQEKVNKLVNV